MFLIPRQTTDRSSRIVRLILHVNLRKYVLQTAHCRSIIFFITGSFITPTSPAKQCRYPVLLIDLAFARGW